jgi:hypothetical protein
MTVERTHAGHLVRDRAQLIVTASESGFVTPA